LAVLLQWWGGMFDDDHAQVFHLVECLEGEIWVQIKHTGSSLSLGSILQGFGAPYSCLSGGCCQDVVGG